MGFKRGDKFEIRNLSMKTKISVKACIVRTSDNHCVRMTTKTIDQIPFELKFRDVIIDNTNGVGNNFLGFFLIKDFIKDTFESNEKHNRKISNIKQIVTFNEENVGIEDDKEFLDIVLQTVAFPLKDATLCIQGDDFTNLEFIVCDIDKCKQKMAAGTKEGHITVPEISRTFVFAYLTITNIKIVSHEFNLDIDNYHTNMKEE